MILMIAQPSAVSLRRVGRIIAADEQYQPDQRVIENKELPQAPIFLARATDQVIFY
jgi:hypothetical protein